MSISMSKLYGNVSWTKKVTTIASLLFYMPLVLVWALLSSPFHATNARKSWKRVLVDRCFYFLADQFSAAQLQWLMGDTHQVYMDWTKQNGLPALTDDLGENTGLLWIGKPRTDRVILYLHGGAFLLPMTQSGAQFWKQSLVELKERGTDVGLAILNYSLIPTASFPTPLRQAVVALEYLISTGISPENIQIAGEIGGGNLALQLISHILHPLDGIPRVKLSTPIRGVYLMSPWVSPSDHGDSFITNDGNDLIGAKPLVEWGRQALDGVPDSQRHYIEPTLAPQSWFKDAKTVVGRVLISVGDMECLRDSVIEFADQFRQDHDETRFVLEKDGVHIGPYLKFLTGEDDTGELAPVIWDWLTEGFKLS